MKRGLLNAIIVVGTTLFIVAIFIGGWALLDKFLTSSDVSYGTRTLYQEASRIVAMEQPVVYAGTEQCGQCHLSAEQEWLHSAHGTVACENCHGPRSAHIENGEAIPMDTSADLCLTCHAQLASRPDNFPQVHFEEHSGGLSCLQCHSPMNPDISHPPQMSYVFSEKVECLACHGSQNFLSVPADHALRSGETCSQCHIEEE